jgi:hypothetical protein
MAEVTASASAPQNATRAAPFTSPRAARPRAEGAERRKKDQRAGRNRRNSPVERRQPGDEQRQRRAGREGQRRGHGGLHRARGRGLGDAQFLARVDRQRILCHQRFGNLSRQSRFEPALLVDAGKLIDFLRPLLGEFLGLAREVRLLGVGLRTDRHVLTGSHRHGAGDEAGDAGNEDGAVSAPAEATPAMMLAVDTMPSLAPMMAARSQPMR